jgi:beta-glucanase (GH16 family)
LYFQKKRFMKNVFSLLLFVLAIAACTDDEPIAPTLPTITINDISVTETDATQTIELDVVLSSASASNVVFNYTTVSKTAVAGIDFINVEDKVFVIDAGVTTAKLPLTIKGDDVIEQTETFEVVFLNAVGATLSQTKAVVTINDEDTNSGSIIPTSGYTTPNSYPNLNLIWADEFSGSTLASHWTHEIGGGGWGNNELQYYRAENTTLQEGHLVIEARQENYGGRNYTSSRMITKDNFDFKYGRVDIRAALPKGQGMWPALWMLGANFATAGWPSCGEIDIMELIGHQPNRVHGTVHWQENGHASYGGSKALSSGDFSTEFHVFSIIWDTQSIKWLVDDVQYHQIDITPAALNAFHKNFFFIFNIAVGGNWPGSPDATTVFPQRMIVDYVRVFQ